MTEQDAVATELRKIANLIALAQVAKLTKGEQARVLGACGFSTRDIAALIGTTEGSIRALQSQARKRSAGDD